MLLSLIFYIEDLISIIVYLLLFLSLVCVYLFCVSDLEYIYQKWEPEYYD